MPEFILNSARAQCVAQGLPSADSRARCNLAGMVRQESNRRLYRDSAGGRAMKGRSRISAAEWRAKGGLRNSQLFRVQSANGRWRYYEAAQ